VKPFTDQNFLVSSKTDCALRFTPAITKFSVSSTNYIYVLLIIPEINNNSVPTQINRLIFVMKALCVHLEVLFTLHSGIKQSEKNKPRGGKLER
jgi:hypothetical protein